MKWNWQRVDWPNFHYDSKALEEYEKQFLYELGTLEGAKKHAGESLNNFYMTQVFVDEAISTSAIEGEYLDRESVQSSIQKALGLKTSNKKESNRERGISRIIMTMLANHGRLCHATLTILYNELIQKSFDPKSLHSYRTSHEPMQIISYGKWHEPIVHFEAPPAAVLYEEMDRFIEWFNKEPQSLAKAGLAHLYFISIHPFEDGNGRIARAIAHMALPGMPLIAISSKIYKRRKMYYDMLEKSNKNLEVTAWLSYFAQEILGAQKYTQELVDFTINKVKFYDRARGLLNERQDRVIERVFKEGIDGFKGGLSAENYMTITGATKSTTTRDLRALVKNGLMTKQGELKSTRYFLAQGFLTK